MKNINIKKSVCFALTIALTLSILTSCSLGGSTELSVDFDTFMGYIGVTDAGGEVYINEYVDFSFAPTSNWTFSSDDELSEMMELDSSDVDTAEKRQEKILSIQNVYTANAVSTYGANVIIGFENLEYAFLGTMYDESAYLDAVISQCEEMDYTFGDTFTASIGGHSYLCTVGTVEQEGITVYQEFLVRKIDDFMFFVIATAIDGYGETLDEMVAFCSSASNISAAAASYDEQSATSNTADADIDTDIDMAYVLGSADGSQYINDFAELTLTVSDGWYLYSDEEVLELMGISNADSYTDEELNQILSSMQVVYGAVADDEIGTTVMIFFENLGVSIDGTSYDSASYTDLTISQLEESGYTVESPYTVEIRGNTYYRIDATLDYDGLLVSQTALIRRIDDFMFGTMVTSIDGYSPSVDEVLSMLS